MRWRLVGVLCLAAGGLWGESAHYSFTGKLQGELPLEVEFLSLARKHGLNVNAMVAGSLSVRSAKTVFDPLGTSSVELKLTLGAIQELSARLRSETLFHGIKGNILGGAQIRFSQQNISVKDPHAFPARIGLPSPTGTDSAFVLEGISLQLDQGILGQLGNGVEEPVGSLQGKIFLKQKGGKQDGELAELDFTVTDLKKKRRSLWDSQEWRSVATMMDQMSAGLEGDELPLLTDLTEEPDDGLILIPEPATFGLLAGLCGGIFILLQRRRRAA